MKLFKKNFLYIAALISLTLVSISFLSIPELKKTLFVFAFILVLFSFLICYLIEKNIQQVFNKVINFNSLLSEGDFDNKEPQISTFDDLDPPLRRSLNELSTKLSSIFLSLKKEKSELEAILGAMSEGVIVVSGKGIVTLINKSAVSMLKLEKESLNKPYWEVIRNKHLHDLISFTLKRNKTIKKEILIVYPEERYYLVNTIMVDPNVESGEIIVVMFDITEFKKLEKIKADFVANVSHELRTPLASIKGYTETLYDEAYDTEKEQKQFLEIISSNTNRLNTIVSDLLILSELEGRETYYQENERDQFDNININELVRNTFATLSRKLKEKNLREKIELANNLPQIKGTKFFLEQLLTNLIDNAIKYTPHGGEVSVKSYAMNGNVNLKISDTGIGIPKEDQDRIFERFYRVDKNRSREMGGTGLGLSIVKHIVLAHSGTIELESEEGIGSTFKISLPIIN